MKETSLPVPPLRPDPKKRPSWSLRWWSPRPGAPSCGGEVRLPLSGSRKEPVSPRPALPARSWLDDRGNGGCFDGTGTSGQESRSLVFAGWGAISTSRLLAHLSPTLQGEQPRTVANAYTARETGKPARANRCGHWRTVRIEYRLYSRKLNPKTGKRRNLGTLTTVARRGRTPRARGAVL